MNKTFGDNFKMPMNTSRGRNAFSFRREQRFSPTNQFVCKQSYYNPSLQKMNRTTSFGFGQRAPIATNLQRSPSPGQYDPLYTSKLVRGYSFGHTRRASFVDSQSSFDNPPPTKYQKTLFDKSSSFSFRSKYEDPLERHKNSLGPGEYKITGLISSKGNYFLSNYKGSGCGKIGKEKRFQQSPSHTPGPGKYKDTLGIDPQGIYFNSRIQSKGIRSFGKPNSNNLFPLNFNPGPGTYYNFSSFQPY